MPPSDTTDTPSELDPLAAFCARHDLAWNEAIAEKFATYLELIESFRDSMNLIGDLRRDAIVGELLVDSLAAAAVRAPTGTMLDVGTGAGLPGIPLKIVAPERPLTLVEPRRKRSTFLRIARQRLGLEEVRIERTRIESLADERFDYVISKAFRPPEDWLPIAAGRVAEKGVVICMTTAEHRDEVEAGAEACELQLVHFAAPDAASGSGAESETDRRIAVLEALP